jgi:hypothetical protein
MLLKTDAVMRKLTIHRTDARTDAMRMEKRIAAFPPCPRCLWKTRRPNIRLDGIGKIPRFAVQLGVGAGVEMGARECMIGGTSYHELANRNPSPTIRPTATRSAPIVPGSLITSSPRARASDRGTYCSPAISGARYAWRFFSCGVVMIELHPTLSNSFGNDASSLKFLLDGVAAQQKWKRSRRAEGIKLTQADSFKVRPRLDYSCGLAQTSSGSLANAGQIGPTEAEESRTCVVVLILTPHRQVPQRS